MIVNDRCVELIENYPEPLEVLYRRSGVSSLSVTAMRQKKPHIKLNTIKKLAHCLKVDWRELTDEPYDEKSIPVNGNKLYNRMVDLGLTYQELADRTGRHKQTIYQLINGSNTTKETLERVGEVLGMTIDEMRVEE